MGLPQALQAALGSSKEYTLKHYLLFAEKIKSKASVCPTQYLVPRNPEYPLKKIEC